MLGDLFERFKDSGSRRRQWVLSPVDFWSDELQQELITSEESGQQGSITHAYASVDARHGASLSDNSSGCFVQSCWPRKMGLQATDRRMRMGLYPNSLGCSLTRPKMDYVSFKSEYNVVEWD